MCEHMRLGGSCNIRSIGIWSMHLLTSDLWMSPVCHLDRTSPVSLGLGGM
jgi:hypothetical protein